MTVGCCFLAAAAVVRASDFGWNPADSTEALQRAFDSGARTVLVDRQTGDWVTRPLFVTNANQEIVFEDGVILKAKRGEFRNRHDCLLTVGAGAANLVIRGMGRVTLAMNKADYVDPSQGYVQGEWRHTLSLVGGAADVLVSNVTCSASGGDGVYVNGGRRIRIEDVHCVDHHRQGISVIDAVSLRVRRCSFSRTSGAAPQCGIDIEPNGPANRVEDVVFEDCDFGGNASSGILVYVGGLNDSSRPVSATFRNCRCRGNRNCGIAVDCGNAERPVRGSVVFENCVCESNDWCPVRVSELPEGSLDVRFRGCVLDARGAKSKAAVCLENKNIARNLGGVSFESVFAKIDKGTTVCSFAAMSGVGLTDVRGRIDYECAGTRGSFPLERIVSRNRPQPELLSSFSVGKIDFRKVAGGKGKVSDRSLHTPWIRRAFTFVLPVPTAGDYPILVSVRDQQKDCGEITVRMRDRMGTDLGVTTIDKNSGRFVVHADAANVYRLEVDPQGNQLQLTSPWKGSGLLAVDYVRQRGGRDYCYYFRVPKGARKVQADFWREEPASARICDAQGKVLADLPLGTTRSTLTVDVPPLAKDVVWRLELPVVEEDCMYRLGGDAVPVLSMHPKAAPVIVQE